VTETTVKTLSSVLEMLVVGGLPGVSEAKFLENGKGMGLKQEDLAANLAVARIIHSLHTVIFIENRRPEFVYQKDGDGQPLGFIEEIDFGLKGYEVKIPDSAKVLEAYGQDCIKTFGLEKEYPAGFLEVGILMFACHAVRQYYQATLLKKRFDWRSNRKIISIADKQLRHRLDQVFRDLAAETRIDDQKAARNFPFEFDARVVKMAILETLAKKGTAYDVIKGLMSEPPTIPSLAKKFILG